MRGGRLTAQRGPCNDDETARLNQQLFRALELLLCHAKALETRPFITAEESDGDVLAAVARRHDHDTQPQISPADLDVDATLRCPATRCDMHTGEGLDVPDHAGPDMGRNVDVLFQRALTPDAQGKLLSVCARIEMDIGSAGRMGAGHDRAYEIGYGRFEL